MAKRKENKYSIGSGDNKREWRTELKPRSASGLRGSINITQHFTDDEYAQILNHIKSDATTPKDGERDILAFCGIERETAKADTTDTKLEELKKAVVHYYTEEKLNTKQIKQRMEKAKIPEELQKKALPEAFKKTTKAKKELAF